MEQRSFNVIHVLLLCSYNMLLIRWRVLTSWPRILTYTHSGASIPLRQWCISPLFQIFPLFPKKLPDSKENFPDFSFSHKIFRIFRFSSAQISDDFFYLVIDQKFWIFPLFRENYCFPYFYKFPPWFRKNYVFVTCFMCISFAPYFDHDAFMHHTTHVLDAPG